MPHPHPALRRAFIALCVIALALVIALLYRPSVALGVVLAADLFAVAVVGLIYDDAVRPKRRPNKQW